MRKLILLFALVCALTVSMSAQFTQSQPRFYGNRTTDPSVCSNLYGSLYWNKTSSAFKYCSATNTWTAFGAGGGAAVGSPVTGGTSGSVPYFDASGNLAQDNANLFWNTTAKSLKVTGGLVGDTANQTLTLSSANGAALNYNGANFFRATATETLIVFNNRQLKFNAGGSGFRLFADGGDTDLGVPGLEFAKIYAVQLITSGLQTGFTTVTTTYSIGVNDHFVCANTTSAAFTATLPTAVGITGKEYVVKDCNGTSLTNNVTIATTSGQSIDGATTRVINSAYGSVSLVSNGTGWKVF